MNMNTPFDYMGTTLTESIAGSREYALPTRQLIRATNKCLDSIKNPAWWVIKGSVKYQVQLQINNVQACVFNTVNDLSIKLMN
jgi:hypothetical protein